MVRKSPDTPIALKHGYARSIDLPVLAEFNRQLIEDESHSNSMTVDQLADRIRGWMKDESHRIVLFRLKSKPVAYAAYRAASDHVYLRQLFVARECRRAGIGKQVLKVLEEIYWCGCGKVILDVLAGNREAHRFYESNGYSDYCITMEKPIPKKRRSLAKAAKRRGV